MGVVCGSHRDAQGKRLGCTRNRIWDSRSLNVCECARGRETPRTAPSPPDTYPSGALEQYTETLYKHLSIRIPPPPPPTPQRQGLALPTWRAELPTGGSGTGGGVSHAPPRPPKRGVSPVLPNVRRHAARGPQAPGAGAMRCACHCGCPCWFAWGPSSQTLNKRHKLAAREAAAVKKFALALDKALKDTPSPKAKLKAAVVSEAEAKLTAFEAGLAPPPPAPAGGGYEHWRPKVHNGKCRASMGRRLYLKRLSTTHCTL